MAEPTPSAEEQAGLASAPIIPSLPEIQSAVDPLALLKTPSPVITPVIPSGTPSSFAPARQLEGDYQTGPVPGAKRSNVQKAQGTLNFVKAAVDYMQDDNTVKDRYKYGRTYSYGSSYKNMNFERYYKHPKFKELGFSPYRDNEAVYNDNSSWWDDFNRMRGEWGGLAWSGFKSVWGDEHAAHESMEKGMAIGSSSRDGFGGWVTNFGLNSAYTVGILAEVVLEDAALMALEAATVGGATPLVAAQLGKQAWSFKRLAEAWKGTYEFMKTLRSFEKTKELFTAAKAGEKLKDFANWVTPFRETREWSTHLAKGTNGVDKMGDLAKTARTVGNFYRDIRELNLAHSEAKLEGEGASAEYQDKLIDEFYSKNGRMPEGAEAQDIFDRAQSVKSAVTLANDYTIYLTNKLVFENIFKPYNPTKIVADAFYEGSGRTLRRTAAKEFKVGTKAAYDVADDNIKNKIVNGLFKSEYVPWSRRYFLGNLSEAIQENSQEVITQAALDYHDRINSDPSQVGFYSSLISTGKAIKGQFSQQGLDTFLQGYLMGSLIQGGGGFLKKMGTYGAQGASGLAHYATKGKYGTEFGSQSKEDLAKAQAEQTENERLNSVNFILDNALIYGGNKSDVAAAIKNIYEAKNTAEQNGDEHNARNLNHEAVINHYHSLARTNSMGLITEHVDDMLTLDDKSLEDAYNNQDTAANIRQKLTTLSERAQGYQNKYDKYKELKPNKYNPWMYDKEKQPEMYEQEMNNFMAHEQLMADVLFSTEIHEDISRRMAGIGTDLMGEGDLGKLFNVKENGNPVANAVGSDLSILADANLRKRQMLDMAARISVLKQGTKEQVKEAGLLQKQLSMLTEWNAMSDTFMRELKSESRASVSPEEQAARRQRANLFPGTTMRDNDTGEILTVFKHIVGKKKAGTLLKDKNGNTIRYDANKHSKVKDAPGTPSRFREVEGEGSTFATERLYELFDKYVKFVAKTKNGFVFNEQQQEAFAKIKDFIRLSVEERKIVNTINLLSDPQMFEKYFNWQSEIMAMARKAKAAAIDRGFEKFKDMAEKNKMLSKLFDLGVFVLPEDVKKLKAFEIPQFYDKVNKSIVEEGTAKYEDAVKIVEEYAAKQGKTVIKPKPKAEEPAAGAAPAATAATTTTTTQAAVDEAFTSESTIEDLKTKHQPLLKKLIPAYRDWYNETYEESTTATDDEIMGSEDFMDFIRTTAKGKTIVDQYNQGRTMPAEKKKAAPSVTTVTRADIEKDKDGNFVPKKYTLNAKGENPAPNIPASAIKDESFGGEKPTDVKQVKLLEIRGKNAQGVTVGKVWIQLETGESYEAEVFFNDAELAALGEKKEAIKEAPSKLEPISDLIYEEFKSSGRVSPFVLEKIAARIVDGTPLTDREKEINAVKKEDIDRYQAKIKEERSKAAVPTMITKAMRQELIEDLRYTKDQVDKMKPAEAQKIIEQGIMNPELARMEEEAAKDDLVAKLAAVETAEQLEEWKKDAAEFRLAPESERNAFEKRHGVTFNGDYVRDQVERKIIELRDNLSIDTLTPTTSVKLLNGRIMVVKSNDGNTIILGDPMNDPDVKTVTVPKEEIQNVILMKNGEFVDTAEEVELTPEEMDDAKKEVDKARTELDDKKLNEIIDESIAVDPQQAKQNAIDKLKSCKR